MILTKGKKKVECREEASKKKLKALNPAFGLNYGLLPAPASAYNMSQ